MNKEKVLIGWGCCDVTPTQKNSLRGQFHVRIAEETHDPLTATALALESESGKEQVIMVSLDAGSVSEVVWAGCQKAVKEKLPDFDSAKLFINSTHTHTAPEQPGFILGPSPKLDDSVLSGAEYGDFLIEKISEAAVNAWKNRKAGGISWGNSYAVTGFNRRVSYFDGSTQMYGNTDNPEFSHIEGHEDSSVNLLFTYDSENKLTGMIINVPCPSQCDEGAYFVSADFWHDTRESIRTQYGDIFVLPQCSAAGDLSPRPMVNRSAYARMLKLKGYGDVFDPARRQDIADKLLAAVNEVFPLLGHDIHQNLEFFHRVINLDLPEREVTASDLDSAKSEVAKWEARLEELKGSDPASSDYSSAYRRFYFNKHVIGMYEEQQAGRNTMPVELHILRIGNIAMCTNRFEYYLDFGERIKARSKALQTFVVQLAGAGGYLPPVRSLKGGGYGAFIASTPICPEGGQIIVEETIKEINKMFG